MKPRILLLLAMLGLTAACGQVERVFPFGGMRDTAPPAATDPDSETPDPDMPGDGEPGPEVEAEPPPPEAPLMTPVIDPANPDALDSERVICEEKGGRWSRAGNTSAYACVYPTRDANKACTSATQCEGYCLARSGTCAPVKPLFGCNEILSSSGALQNVCVN
ncbi:hypothetical protein [Psychromarinibacter sp. S121]|uniref:hypothetical protein n=1 Tax=Psychromarinibacter sp. S121 TaxID=3415127 RepID=UPI003C7A38DA